MIIIKTKKYKECFCYFLTIIGVIVVLFFVFCGFFFHLLIIVFLGMHCEFLVAQKETVCFLLAADMMIGGRRKFNLIWCHDFLYFVVYKTH